jgi:NADPH2:quinone reductase
MQSRIFVTGSLLRPRSVEFKRQIKSRLLEHVWPLLASGRIKPIVDKVFPLAEAGRAQAYMESSVHKGKILLAVADASN